MNVKRAGIFLIILGSILLAYSGYKFILRRRMLDSGMIKPNPVMAHKMRWTPIIGTTLFIGGIIMAGRDFKVHT